MNKIPSLAGSGTNIPLLLHMDQFLRAGILKLLAIKDSDIRILTLEQSRDAVDLGLHAGGAFSATIPLVALFYGGFLKLDGLQPGVLARRLVEVAVDAEITLRGRGWGA